MSLSLSLFVIFIVIISDAQAKDLRAVQSSETSANNKSDHSSVRVRKERTFFNFDPYPPMMGGMGLRSRPMMGPIGPRPPPPQESYFSNTYSFAPWALLQQAGAHILGLLMEIFIASAVEQMVNPQVGFHHHDYVDFDGPMPPHGMEMEYRSGSEKR